MSTNFCEVVLEEIEAHDVILNITTVVALSSSPVDDSTITGVAFGCIVEAEASDGVIEDAMMHVDEAAVVEDSTIYNLSSKHLESEIVVVRDLVVAGLSLSAGVAVECFDSVCLIDPGVSVGSTAYTSDIVSISLATVVADKAYSSAALFDVLGPKIEELCESFDGAMTSLQSAALVGDFSHLDSWAAPTLASAIEFTDGVSAYDLTSMGMATSVLVGVVGSAYDKILLPTDLGGLDIALFTGSSGMTFLSGIPFNSYFTKDGKVYGVSRDGIYLVGGGTDDGATINAEVETGFLDLGSPQRKRISDLYLSCRTDGAVSLDVIVDESPTPIRSAILDNRGGPHPRTERIKVGKGSTGVYWKLKLKNIDCTAWDMTSVDASVAESNRRIR